MLHTVIFIGRSGCGKGTQAGLFKDRIARMDEKNRQILYIETGEYFRKFIREKSFSAGISREIYDKAGRQPDFLSCWIWSDVMVNELMPDMHVVFDGAPRSLPESIILTTAMKFYKREKPTVIYLNVSRQSSEKRLLSRGRDDDKALSKVTERMNWFDNDTMPAVEFFKKEPLYRFIEVNGEQSIEKVHSDIVAAYDYSA